MPSFEPTVVGHRRIIERGRAAAPVLLGLAISSVALAADLQPGALSPGHAAAPDTASEQLQAVVVTATLIRRPGFTSPTPETTVTASDIAASAPANIADYLNQLPQVAGSNTPVTGPIIISSGDSGANLLNLRDLGEDRTLVLLDGRRVAGATPDGLVDINTLPTTLVQRVDIVTGGASATYGSDAVAGVVNFVLDQNFTGLKADVQVGGRTSGGDKGYKVEVAGGWGFGDGRGHVLLSASDSQSDGGPPAGNQSWFNGQKMVPNPSYAPGNGQPNFLFLPHANLSVASYGGLITNGVLAGTEFGYRGAISQRAYGNADGIYSIGGERQDLTAFYPLASPLEQRSVFSHVSYDISDGAKPYAQFIYSDAVASPQSVPNFALGKLTIQSDNAYLPASLAARLAAAGQTSFKMGTFNPDMGVVHLRNERELSEFLAGLGGELGHGWSYDAYAEYGRTNILIQAENSEIPANYTLATDAVVGPSGSIVCRSTLSNPGNGCVPYDPFGYGVNSQAAVNYVTGTSMLSEVLQESVASGSIQGEPFALWAGPVSVAGGVQYRKEEINGWNDPLSRTGGFYLGNYLATNGQYHVSEAFVETLVPLARGLPGAYKLEFDGAFRETHYSTSGSVSTWKLGLNYSPVKDLRFRATVSRDIRAPNLNDLYLGGRVRAQQTVIDPRTGLEDTGITQTVVGNPSLKPERATTFTTGVVYQPGWLPGLATSVDLYDIKIDEAISTLTIQQVVSGCYAGEASLCSLIAYNASGAISSVLNYEVNVAHEHERGIDAEVDYRRYLDSLHSGWPGAVTFRVLGTYVHTHTLDILGATVEGAGVNGGDVTTAVPHMRLTTSLGYQAGRFNGTVDVRTISSGVYRFASTPVTLADNHIPGAAYVDFGFAWRMPTLGGEVQFYANVDNALDKDPVPVGNVGQQFLFPAFNDVYYDVLGRVYRAGLRLRF